MPSGERGKLRAATAVVGIGMSELHKHGEAHASEFEYVIRAILSAAKDANINVKEIDGFLSYASDRNEPPELAAALGIDELRFGALQFGGSGGGSAGHVSIAAAAIAAGLASCVVVYKGCVQGEVGRFGMGRYGQATGSAVSGYLNTGGSAMAPYGVYTPAARYAPRAARLFDQYGLDSRVTRAIALASYYHAQHNLAAVMYGKPLTAEKYDASRFIAEPLRLYDCCLECDAAAAMVIVSAERARDLRDDPVYILAAGQSGLDDTVLGGENGTNYPTAGFRTLAPRLYQEAGISVNDVDAFQVYLNFTIGAVMALVEFGVCSYEDATEVLQFENLIAPSGKFPFNTSGGDLAEAYILGMGLHLEAVRQLRGTSTNQVPGASINVVAGAPMTPMVSGAIYGSGAVL